MTHSLPGIFLTFPVPALLVNIKVRCKDVRINQSRTRRKRTQTERCWLRLPRLFFCLFFSTLLYQQFTEIASASTMGREPPTHQTLFKHTFLRCWEQSPTTMLPWSSGKREEGLSGVKLLQTWERFSIGIKKVKADKRWEKYTNEVFFFQHAKTQRSFE